MPRRLVLTALACLYGTGVGLAASFDCKAAVTGIERMICKSSELGRRDALMARLYDAANKRDTTVREKQRQWLAGLRACRDTACLTERYDARIGEILDSRGGQAVATHFFNHAASGNEGALSLFGPVQGLTAVSISSTYEGPGGAEAGDVNADGASGVMALSSGRGELKKGHCVIALRPTKARSWRVEQNGRCSLAAGVTFAGTYRK